MVKEAFNFEVTTPGTATIRKHRGDSVTVDDRGHLLIFTGDKTGAIYSPGQWIRVHQVGNFEE